MAEHSLVEPMPSAFGNPVSRYFAATRPPFLTATLVACMLGIAIARHDGVAIQSVWAIATLLLALLVHAAVNVLNDYYDALSGTDAANQERLFPFTGGSRFIQNGVMTLRETAVFGYAMLAIAMLGGLWLVAQAGVGLLWIGAIGLMVGWAYSAEPLTLNARGWGELCVLAGFLGLVIGADFVQRQAFDARPWLIGLPYALLVTNLLYINQFPDRAADAAVGKRHWVVRLPVQRAVWGYPLLALLAAVVLVADVLAGWLSPWALLAGIPVGFSLLAAHVLVKSCGQPSHLRPAIQYTLLAMLGHGLLLSLILFLEPR